MRGRLIDDATGRPLEGVVVGGLYSDRVTEEDVAAWQQQDAESLRLFREWNAENDPAVTEDDLGGYERAMMLSYPTVTTPVDGSFTLDLDVPCSSSRSAFGIQVSSSGDGPREGLAVLRLERPGHPPVRIRVPAGDWRRRQGTYDHGQPYAFWDLGDIRVPSGAR